MGKFRLKKGVTVGALAAENDSLLQKAFIDLGYEETLSDVSSPVFLVLGRTGSGKTALIRKLSEHHPNTASALDPSELSMQYLHNSNILSLIHKWGVNLDIFYKYLWRHVCILELIRLRYKGTEDLPSAIQRIFPIEKLFKKNTQKTKEAALNYIDKYGDDYWIRADTRIKSITTELETKLIEDAAIGASLKMANSEIGAKIGANSSESSKQVIEQEVIHRTQSIVSDFLVADLNHVVDLLEKHGFTDEQKRYSLIVDDLDTNWMPNNDMYIGLVKSLLYTVNELNHRLKSVKIVVALRENIYFRIFQKTTENEPQREKWADVRLRIRWAYGDLVKLMETRLKEVFRGQYTETTPTFWDILPSAKKKKRGDPVDYILARTLMRPRDVIDFVNTYIEHTDSLSQIGWANLIKAEIEYSKRRLDSLHDEWKDSFFGIPACYDFLKSVNGTFKLDMLDKAAIEQILTKPIASECKTLRTLQNSYLEGACQPKEARKVLLDALYITGLVGIKPASSDTYIYSHEDAFSVGTFQHLDETTQVQVHKMYWAALGIHLEQDAGRGAED